MKLCIVELIANKSFFFLLPKPVGKKSIDAPVALHSTIMSAFFTNTIFFMDWMKHQMNKTKNKCLTVNTNKILLKHLHLFKHYPYMIPT